MMQSVLKQRLSFDDKTDAGLSLSIDLQFDEAGNHFDRWGALSFDQSSRDSDRLDGLVYRPGTDGMKLDHSVLLKRTCNGS